MVRDATARSLAGLFETTKTLVETTAGLFTYDLDFFSTLPSKVDSLTTSEVVPQFSWSVREETFVGAMVDLNGHDCLRCDQAGSNCLETSFFSLR